MCYLRLQNKISALFRTFITIDSMSWNSLNSEILRDFISKKHHIFRFYHNGTMFRNLISESQLRVYGRKKSKNAKIDSFPMQKKKHELKRSIYSIKRLQLEIITLFTLRHDVTVQFVHKGASWHFLYFQSFDCIWSRNKNLIRISYCSIALRVNGAFHKLWSEAPIVGHLKSEWNR